MILTSARLQNYRSYSDSSFEFEPHVNIIVGPNASGKTNLLDALFLTASGASMKPTKGSMVKDNEPWARIDVLTNTNQARLVKIPNSLSKPELSIDDKLYKRLPLDKRLPVVLFEPNQLYFLTNSPDMRRQLIDDILDKIDPDFPTIRSRYTRTLQQRNHLLKQPLHQVADQVFAWDVRLCDLAGQYATKRQQLITLINDKAPQIYSSVAGSNHNLEFSYESTLKIDSYANSLLTKLQQNIALDHARGFTGYGPHRDDVKILINNHDMRSVASRGETRSILLSLKIIEAQILKDKHSQKPLLLLDDVFGELDGARRKSLIEFISDNQTFITTTDADIIGHEFTKKAKITAI